MKAYNVLFILHLWCIGWCVGLCFYLLEPMTAAITCIICLIIIQRLVNSIFKYIYLQKDDPGDKPDLNE